MESYGACYACDLNHLLCLSYIHCFLLVPALRSLRPHALIFHFERPSKSALLDRLRYICRHEHVDYDQRALSMLCDLVDNDIRSALNTLQFVHTREQR